MKQNIWVYLNVIYWFNYWKFLVNLLLPLAARKRYLHLIFVWQRIESSNHYSWNWKSGACCVWTTSQSCNKMFKLISHGTRCYSGEMWEHLWCGYMSLRPKSICLATLYHYNIYFITSLSRTLIVLSWLYTILWNSLNC